MSLAADIAPLKEIQKFIWSQGDYERIACEAAGAAEELAAACGITAGDYVLDVGAGTGNAAIAAARRGARVLATDITPRMVELGQARTRAGELAVEWLEADVEALPFDSSSFDCVVSCFAAMFAPRPEVAAKEMFRVVRPGEVVGLANWMPGSFVGRLIQTVASFMPSLPVGVPSPVEWGVEDVVRARLDGLAAEVTVRRSAVVMNHDSVEAMYDFHRRCNGSLVAARMVLGDRYVELEAAIRALISELGTAADGSCQIESEYLLVIGRKR